MNERNNVKKPMKWLLIAGIAGVILWARGKAGGGEGGPYTPSADFTVTIS